MKFQTVFSMAGILSICTCVPIYQPQIGIIASNSNEVLRLNGLTLAGMGLGPAQGTPFFSPFLLQQPPQVLNFNPGFLPPQINPLNPAQLPPLQQDPTLPGIGPNNGLPAQSPPPGFPFFMTNLYPLRTPVRLIPNQNAGPNVNGQATMQPFQPFQPFQPNQPIQPIQPILPNLPIQPIQPIQTIQNRGKAADPKVTPAPDYRGDRPGPGTGEGNPGFPLFEP